MRTSRERRLSWRDCTDWTRRACGPWISLRRSMAISVRLSLRRWRRTHSAVVAGASARGGGVAAPGRGGAPCHNDVHHLNVVGGDELRLIDWEYAGAGEPLFDLASVCVYHGYDRTRRELR